MPRKNLTEPIPAIKKKLDFRRAPIRQMARMRGSVSPLDSTRLAMAVLPRLRLLVRNNEGAIAPSQHEVSEIACWRDLCFFGCDYDQRRNPPVVSRLLQVEAAHHRPVFKPAARRAESALYECRHEPVRADFSRATETAMETATRR